MHVLFLSQVLPYPVDAGPKMRSYFVLRHLVQEHQVTLLTFVRDTDQPENITHLAELCHAVHTVPMQRSRLRDLKFFLQSLVSADPFLIVRDQVPAMIAKIQQLVRSETFDVIHADQLWMAQYALAGQATSPQSKLVLDQHNAVYLIPNRMASGETNPLKQKILARESHLLTRYEPDICRQFDHVVWVTEEDRQAVAQLTPTKTKDENSTVIPICADPTQVKPIKQVSDKRRVTFLGGLHWPPNAQGIVWFAQHVFPKVREALPDTILTVIGKSPPPGLEGEGVEVTGYVPDLDPYLSETGVFIVPLHAGGGMRVKILDAWSWGLPVVSTTIGAEGMEIAPEKNILIADAAQDFAQAVIRVLENQNLAHTLGQGGRQTILDKYDWQHIYSAWDRVYTRTTNGHHRPV